MRLVMQLKPPLAFVFKEVTLKNTCVCHTVFIGLAHPSVGNVIIKRDNKAQLFCKCHTHTAALVRLKIE